MKIRQRMIEHGTCYAPLPYVHVHGHIHTHVRWEEREGGKEIEEKDGGGKIICCFTLSPLLDILNFGHSHRYVQ